MGAIAMAIPDEPDTSSEVIAPPGWAIERLIAVGATGIVHAVRSQGREAVLKSARQRDPDTAARFAREADVLRVVGPPTVPGYLAHGRVGDRAYILMELIAGETLAAYMARVGETGDIALIGRLLADLLGVLGALHRAGYVHRDLKPENIVLDAAHHHAPRLVDLGLARALAPLPPALGSEHVAGTTHYLAPEQIRSGGVIDHRVDLYAFGVIAFELLAGHPPFIGERRAIEYQHQVVRPPALSELRDVPRALEDLVSACLAKHADARPPTAAAALASLHGTAFDDPTEIVPSTVPRSEGRTGSVALAWIVGGDPIGITRAIAEAKGIVVRQRGDGVLAAFTAAEHTDPVATALGVSRELARTAHCPVALHVTDALVRRSIHGRPSVYGPDVTTVETWIPRVPFVGVVLTAPAAALVSDAVPARDVLGFARERDEDVTASGRWGAAPGFVGRASLVEELVAASAMLGVLVGISGGEGTGKSRVLIELSDCLRTRGRTVALIAVRRRFPGEPADDARVLEVLAAADPRTVLLVDEVDRLSSGVRARLLAPTTTVPRVLASRTAVVETDGDPSVLAFELPPLAPGDAQALVRQLLLPARLVPDVLVDRIVVRGIGNPGLLAALARDLKRRGGVRRHAGSDEWYVAADHHDTLLAPPGAEWLALRAVEDLPPDAAAVVRVGAVLGPNFGIEEIAAVAALPVVELAPRLAWLVTHGVLAEQAGWFTFRDAALQEAVSTTMLDERDRRRAHGRALQFWESQPITNVVGWLARVAFHADGAGRRETASACWIALARACTRRGDLDQADALLARAAAELAVAQPAVARAISRLP